MIHNDLSFCAATFHGDQDPVHTAFVCGARLRFFAAPTSDAGRGSAPRTSSICSAHPARHGRGWCASFRR